MYLLHVIQPIRLDEAVSSDHEQLRQIMEFGRDTMAMFEDPPGEINVPLTLEKTFFRVIRDEATGEVMGFAYYYANKSNRGEIGYAVHPMYQRQGLATRMAYSLIAAIPASECILAGHIPENKASAKVLKRCGFEFTHVQRSDKPRNGVVHDSLMYALPESRRQEIIEHVRSIEYHT